MHPTDPIGPQTHIFGHFGLFHYCTNFGVKRAELVQLMHKFVPRCCVRIFSQRTHPIHPIAHQTHVLVRFGLFHYCTNFGAKRAELVQLMHMFMPRSHVCIFFTTNALDPSHWTPNSCFSAFQTISLLQELRCKMGQNGAIYAQVCATKSNHNCSQRTHWIHPIGP
jgi:hypothetical protein